MDVVAILALVEKAVTIISALVSAGQSATPAIQALLNFISGAKQGPVTPEQLAALEATLDGLIADFNLDLPPAGSS